MADKMLRVAARNASNVSKPLELDDFGGLKISDKDLKRITKKGANLLLDYYFEGSEVKAFGAGFSSGTGTLTKNANHVELALSGNAANTAERTLESTDMIDLTGIDFLSFDIEETPNLNYNGYIYLTLGTAKGISESSGGVLRLPVELPKGSAPRRRTLRLNTAAINQSVYVRVHLKDGSPAVDVSTKIKIFSITGERYNTPPLSVTSAPPAESGSEVLTATDLEGNPVELTAAKDLEGKGVLRIVDSAPYGYHLESDSLKVSKPALSTLDTLALSQAIAAGVKVTTPIVNAAEYEKISLLVDAGAVESPLKVEVNYHMTELSTNIIKKETVIDEAGNIAYRGASGSFSPKSPFLSLTLTNNAATSRTVNFKAMGGR